MIAGSDPWMVVLVKSRLITVPDILKLRLLATTQTLWSLWTCHLVNNTNQLTSHGTYPYQRVKLKEKVNCYTLLLLHQVLTLVKLLQVINVTMIYMPILCPHHVLHYYPQVIIMKLVMEKGQTLQDLRKLILTVTKQNIFYKNIF